MDANQEVAGDDGDITALSVLSSGRILLGTNDIQPGFQRIMLNPDGSLDDDFGSAGFSGSSDGDTINPESQSL